MQSELITAIVDLLLERSKHFEAAYAADYQQNISEIFPVLQKLTTGVDVNVKFHNLHAFEVRVRICSGSIKLCTAQQLMPVAVHRLMMPES